MAQRHMDRLSSFDTSFLVNERSNAHMAIGAVMTCRGAAPNYEDFAAHIGSRLHLLPRLRQRLAFPPLRMGTPFWVDHPEFEIGDHVHRVRLPAPGTDAQLEELAAACFSPPLDRSRPLWGLWLVDGFEDDRFGIVYKTHHALADGISAVDIGVLLFDVERRSEKPPEPVPWSANELPSRVRLLGRNARGLGSTAAAALGWIRRAISAPRWAAKRAADGLAGLWEVAWALTKPAPRVPFNVAIGPSRSFRSASCSLEDFKRIAHAFGGTVNDVSLAVTAGALRRWLQSREVETAGLRLRALVPVSMRTEDEHGELGNRLTALRGPLPVEVADPVERLRAVVAGMDALKVSRQSLGARAIWGINDWFRDFAPPLLLAPTAAINFSTRLFNLLVTNFPGPQIPIYVLGRELEDVYPVGFLARRQALAVAIVSYNGAIDFGLLADRAAIGDLEAIAGYVGDSVAELLAAARIASRLDGDDLAGDPGPRRAASGSAGAG